MKMEEEEEQQQDSKHVLLRKQKIAEETFSISVFNQSLETSSTSLNGDFLWFQLFIEVLLRIWDRKLAKEDLIDFAREQYANDYIESQKIAEFSTNYTADTAIKWYTRDSFVYRQLNQALRLRDLNALYMFRLLIIDIYSQLNKMKDVTVTDNASNPHYLYRGQAISRIEIERFQQSVGNYIAMNSFLSTSSNRQVSLIFAEVREGFESVLFTIEADTKLIHAKPFADISMVSYMEQEEETLFMLGAVFRLLSVAFDNEERMWLVRLQLCSNEDSELKPVFDRLKGNIEDKTDSYELARIMIELGDMISAERHLKRFIDREAPNQGTIGGCYMLFGDIAMQRGDLDEAIRYQRQGLALKQQYLPANHPYIPYSHNNLGHALRERGDLNEALQEFNEALRLWRQEYDSDMHENIALCLHNIAGIYGEQDKFELSLEYYNRAYEIRCVCLTPRHPQSTVTLKCIGSVYGNMGATDLSHKIFEKVLNMQRSCLPSTHVDLVDTLHALGVCQINLCRPDQALIHFMEASAICSQSLPPTHYLRLQIENDINEVKATLANKS